MEKKEAKREPAPAGAHKQGSSKSQEAQKREDWRLDRVVEGVKEHESENREARGPRREGATKQEARAKGKEEAESERERQYRRAKKQEPRAKS